LSFRGKARRNILRPATVSFRARRSGLQSGHDRHARGADGREKAAHKANGERKNDALNGNRRAQFEAEHDLREARAKRRGAQAVEDQ